MTKSLLIIFAKNPTLGNVKKRLAATLGTADALAIYHLLLSHTIKVTNRLKMDKVVYYSDFIDNEDKWDNRLFRKELQKGNDLGERMYHALKKGFSTGYEHICIIGTDNFEITSAIIHNGFEHLKEHEGVIGPAFDGGYYLIGMNQPHKELFQNKQWSTPAVFEQTTNDYKTLNLSYALLPTLNDIDTEEDWNNSKLNSLKKK